MLNVPDWYMYAIPLSPQRRAQGRQKRGSLELEFVVDIWRVLCASLGARVHLVRVVPFDAALLVPTKGIAGQI